MRYGPEYKDKTRRRILEAAARLLPQYGFTALTIDRIMAEAGLTRGAFYAYFGSKAELIAAALQEAVLTQARFASRRPPNGTAEAGLPGLDPIDISPAEADESGWSLVLFAVEAARSDPEVREAFTRMLQALATRVTQSVPESVIDSYNCAVIALALHAGASALAHAVTDPVFAIEIRKACERVAEMTLSHGC